MRSGASMRQRRPEPPTAAPAVNGGQPAPPPAADVLSFVLDNAREHAVVLDRAGKIIFRNRKAARFLGRHALPEEIVSLALKLLDAVVAGKVAEKFPGQVCVHKEIGDRCWVFRLAHGEGADPKVAVYFCDETVSGRFDLNALRRRYLLTRRESDVLRHLLDGLKNVEIAEELAITEQTVKDYLSSIYGKFRVSDRFALLRCLVAASPETSLPE